MSGDGSEGNKWIYGNNGKTGFGLTSDPTATIHIKAGSTAAGMAPLKLSSVSLLTTRETGAIEYNGTHLFFTVGSDSLLLNKIFKCKFGFGAFCLVGAAKTTGV